MTVSKNKSSTKEDISVDTITKEHTILTQKKVMSIK